MNKHDFFADSRTLGLRMMDGSAPPYDPGPAPKLSMSVWCATEGGRKCPMCGRYAKEEELGWAGGIGPDVIVDMYGHLPGFGCNA